MSWILKTPLRKAVEIECPLKNGRKRFVMKNDGGTVSVVTMAMMTDGKGMLFFQLITYTFLVSVVSVRVYLFYTLQ